MAACKGLFHLFKVHVEAYTVVNNCKKKIFLLIVLCKDVHIGVKNYL